MKKKVCVCFDYSEDANYRYLLKAWNVNPDFDFAVYDTTPDEIDTNNYSRVKAVLTTRITEATHLLVIVGRSSNSQHPRSNEIGERNWQIWEIKKARSLYKKIVAIKIDSRYPLPDGLSGADVSWAYSFERNQILSALNK